VPREGVARLCLCDSSTGYHRYPSGPRAATNAVQESQRGEKGVKVDGVRLASRLITRTAVASLTVTRAVLNGVRTATHESLSMRVGPAKRYALAHCAEFAGPALGYPIASRCSGSRDIANSHESEGPAVSPPHHARPSRRTSLDPAAADGYSA
jgi:hypothetical protein